MSRRLFRLFATMAMGLLVLVLIGAATVAYVFLRYGRELPDYHQLANYQPPTVTRVHAGDGRLLAEYAREKRIFVPVSAIPARVKNAFIAAEDKNFYRHFGIDPLGILRAVIDNIRRLGQNRRPVGASTITQQVAKNFLLSNELSLERKIKEAILAIRIERTFSKDKILELYLNEIFLGRHSYGVAAAALNYFDKSLDELTISEAAFLAGLPKAPSRYDPVRNPEAARARRDYVIGRMLEDGYITAAQAEIARAEPLTVRRRATGDRAQAAFFVEEVRRRLVERFGEAGFYEGGLSVRATVLPKLQEIADRVVRAGLSAYDRRRGGWRGPVARLKLSPGLDWAAELARVDPGFELRNWRLALVLSADARKAELGFADGSRGVLPYDGVKWARPRLADGSLGRRPKRVDQVVRAGDIVLVAASEEEGTYTLRQRPEVEGALVAMDPHTGRVLAMTGGFSFRQSQFNRATQAKRQPGSAFKPFVYLAALEAGWTPASIVLDAPVVIDQGPGQPKWKPANYSDKFYGPSTLRLGIEKSRNLMTVRLAHKIGMQRIADVARRFGIADDLPPLLSSALGASEVTLLDLTTAYAMLANGGKEVKPIFVERIQDRFGKTVWAADPRPCEGCRMEQWNGQPPPPLPDLRRRVVDPRIAYQIVHIMEGVIQRGTGRRARDLGRPLAGKTGTTNDSRDAWFMGFSPDLVVGVWVGFDIPRSLGRRETGASVALPIWKAFMKEALADKPPTPFRIPPGIDLVRIDADTGLLPGPTTRRTVVEAFLPGTEPTRATAPAATEGSDREPLAAAPASGDTGGLY